jgi:hypothetical protein
VGAIWATTTGTLTAALGAITQPTRKALVDAFVVAPAKGTTLGWLQAFWIGTLIKLSHVLISSLFWGD